MTRFNAFENFRKEESGALSAFGLVTFLTMTAFAGLALDFGNAYRMRTYLQNAADSAGHAAIYTRELNSREDAVLKAVEVANATMPSTKFGKVFTAEDIQFGTWSYEDETFTVDESSKTAVRVLTSQVAARGNGVGTFLLQLLDFHTFDVRREAVYVTYQPTCFQEGFVADDIVDIQSNNAFYNGFCIHSNQHVEVNSNNYFEANTVVSMPDKSTIVLPQSGFETNEGLEAALRDGSYQMRIVNRLPRIMAGLVDPDSDYVPDYITSDVIVKLSSKKLDIGDFKSGHIHTVSCTGGNALKIPAGTIKEVVLVTDCKVQFEQGSIIDNSVIATKNTDAKSMTAPSGLQIGRNDHCAADGGSQLLTMGGIDVAADLKVYGSQLIAKGDILFSANADGIEGASFIAGGEISGTSNMTMGFCGNGMERNYSADYFRIAW